MSLFGGNKLLNNNGFCIKLLTNFKTKIKYTYICDMEIIIVTQNNYIYLFNEKGENNKEKILEINKLEYYESGTELIEKFKAEIICGLEFIKFANTEHQVFAITRSQVYHWGCNFRTENGDEPIYGEKGKEYWFQYFSPEVIENLKAENIIDISCGAYHTLLLMENNTVYGWGSNRHSQLTDSVGEVYQSIPIEVNLSVINENNEEIKMISCGYSHSMILTESGCVYGCGNNENKQLSFTNETSTKRIKNFEKLIIKTDENLVKFKKISCGRIHSLLLSNEGDIYAFGGNNSSQLGTRDKKAHKNIIDCLARINLQIMSDFTDIASHFSFDISVAHSKDDKYYIWGECGDKILRTPREAVFRSFADIFLNHCGITYEKVDGNHRFFDHFMNNGKFNRDFHSSENFWQNKGRFGDVFVYPVKSNLNNESFAIKVKIYPKNYWKSFRDLEICHYLIKQDTEFIVKYIAFWFETEKSDIKFCIQMEKCDTTFEDIIDEMHKDLKLFEEISAENEKILTPFGYYLSCDFFSNILKSVNYLHKLEPAIIHRDLKPENILLKNGSFKVCDFDDIAFHHLEGETHTTDKGSMKYMAPEVEKSGKKYDTRADVYSLGKIFKKLFNIEVDDRY
jgi:serine/threonine protein kinase